MPFGALAFEEAVDRVEMTSTYDETTQTSTFYGPGASMMANTLTATPGDNGGDNDFDST